MEQPLRIGTLGAARITPKALLQPAVNNPATAVVAVAARDPQQASAFAAQHAIPQTHASYADLIADPQIDAIYNPLPNSLHGEWTMRALEAGKHVLCEKPLAANVAEARAMAETADRTGLVLMEAFHTLYHPVAARMKAVMASGELGAIRHVEAHFCTLLRRRQDIRLDYGLGGGAMMDLGCYTVRLLQFLLNAEPAVQQATATGYGAQIDRKMVVELRFPGNITGKLSCAFWSRRLIRITAKVVGESGELFVVNPLLPHLFHLIRIKSGGRTRWERCPGESTYTYQLQAFVDTIRGNPSTLGNGWDGVATMRVIDAAYLAAGLPLRRPFSDQP